MEAGELGSLGLTACEAGADCWPLIR